MLAALPARVDEIRSWTWDQFQPFYDDLLARDLTADTLADFLADWTSLSSLVNELFSRARVATTQDTADEEAESFYKHLMAAIHPPMSKAVNALNKKLVESGLEPEGYAVPLRNLRSEIELFREENLPLQTREQGLMLEYAKITGAQQVEWDGAQITLLELAKTYEDQDRDRREKAFRLQADRWLEDRHALNDLWTRLYPVREEMARNAGFDNYRDYAFRLRRRFDYTPEDCETFHRAIEQVVIPAKVRIDQRRQARLGVETLRPWDLNVDPEGRPPLRPWETIEDFAAKAEQVFYKVDPSVGDYFATMRREDLLDLPNRPNKGPGAYCTAYPAIRRPFVFMNAVNLRGDVRTLLHEAGHAFHTFEVLKLPYAHQRSYPTEFAEVASMAMELLAAPYLSVEQGGYFTPEEAARDRIGHLEKIILFWPYMAVVDAFQLWAYTTPDGADPAACDAKWGELWSRFQPGVDFSGLEDYCVTGWHRKQHIFRYPFYYVEYGLAQLGAVQVWANALTDQPKAVADYLHGLSLGYTVTLPELYQATGAKFAFDADTLGQAVDLIERTISDLEAQLRTPVG
jgi:oligoendopeptidase F